MQALLRVVFIAITTFLLASNQAAFSESLTQMRFYDSSRIGLPFAKDPSVIQYGGRYLLYYSLPPRRTQKLPESPELFASGWGIGIAESRDLIHWMKIGEVPPVQDIEHAGIAAPRAHIINGIVHLFYQSYGHGANDAICHAWSSDGTHFTRDPSNPIYRPTQMPWSAGRAIDAEILISGKRAYLYFATRDRAMKIQMLGMAEAEVASGLGAGSWRDLSTSGPILKPELPWEGSCIEAPSVIQRGKSFYLFYGGAYNSERQQIGVAVSSDAIHWRRLSDRPLLAAGDQGAWNSTESGHPGVFQAGNDTYLFFQGSNDHGNTYVLSVARVGWRGNVPYVMSDGH